MRNLIVAVIVLVAAGCLLASCTGFIVALDKSSCSSDRTVQVTRTNGEPEHTSVKARRVCGEPLPPDVEPEPTPEPEPQPEAFTRPQR